LLQDALEEWNDPRARSAWEAHLLSCEACRLEKARVQALLGKIRAAGAVPALSSADADSMARKVLWRLRNADLGVLPKRRPLFKLGWALASAGVLIIAAFAGYRLHDRMAGAERVATLPQELQLPKEDFEVIENLDLLRQMDTIDKLVNVVDTSNGDTAPAEPEKDTQGMKSDDYGNGVA
jgi:hypothetical protein